MKKIKETTPISWKTYCKNTSRPKLFAREDIIKYLVNKEDEGGILQNVIPKIILPPRVKLSDAVVHALSREIYSFFAI